MQIKMIVATDLAGAIGKNNDLLFHNSRDLKFFKRMTENHAVVMGLNTWYSLPKRPFPNRFNMVLSDQPINEEVNTYRSIEEAISEAKQLGYNTLWVVGGGSVYNQFLLQGLIDEALITIVDTVCDADVFIDPEALAVLSNYQQEITDEYKYDGKYIKVVRYYKEEN